MCCRYYVELSPELRPIVEAARQSVLAAEMNAELGKAFKSEGEIRPTDLTAVLAPDKAGKRKAYPMVWGFKIPGIKGPVVNARMETASQKASFRESFARRRCVIPASYYFEWEHYQEGGRTRTGDKYAIQPEGSLVTWLAGLYRIEEGHMGFKYPVFTVLTREPAGDLLKIHNRMPVILPEDVIDQWVWPGTKEGVIKELLHDHSLTDMIMEKCTIS